MRTMILTLAAAAALGLAAPAATVAQGPPEKAKENKEKAAERAQQRANERGQARGQGQGQRPQNARPGSQGQARGQARGQDAAAERRGPPAHARAKRGGPAPDRAAFNRDVVRKAVRAHGRRGERARGVDVRRGDGRLRVVRDDGQLLFELDESTANDLGYWRAVVAPEARDRRDRDDPRARDRNDRRDRDAIFGTGDRYPAERADADRGGAPAFCRSGEGHPVWGRDWCLDKGFGLGDRDRAWGVDRTIEDIILRRPDPRRDVVDRGGLIDILGDVVFGRLALQSLVLGADEPLTGRWLAPQQEGPRVLRVQAGDLPVAELVDYGGDGSVDRILFNLGS